MPKRIHIKRGTDSSAGKTDLIEFAQKARIVRRTDTELNSLNIHAEPEADPKLLSG